MRRQRVDYVGREGGREGRRAGAYLADVAQA